MMSVGVWYLQAIALPPEHRRCYAPFPERCAPCGALQIIASSLGSMRGQEVAEAMWAYSLFG